MTSLPSQLETPGLSARCTGAGRGSDSWAASGTGGGTGPPQWILAPDTLRDHPDNQSINQPNQFHQHDALKQTERVIIRLLLWILAPDTVGPARHPVNQSINQPNQFHQHGALKQTHTEWQLRCFWYRSVYWSLVMNPGSRHSAEPPSQPITQPVEPVIQSNNHSANPTSFISTVYWSRQREQ